MNSNQYDVVVAKEYEVENEGVIEKRTAWNKVGFAWDSRTTDALSFELFLIPGQRYVISPRKKSIPLSASETGEIQNHQKESK